MRTLRWILLYVAVAAAAIAFTMWLVVPPPP